MTIADLLKVCISGLNSSMGRAADRNPEGVSLNLASANTFFVLVKNNVIDMISL